MTDVLIEDLRAGGKRRSGAFERLYDAHALRMLRYFARQGLRAEEGEDALQETFLHAVRAIDGFRGSDGPSLAAWLWAIARNCLTNVLRRRLDEESLDAHADDDTLDALLAANPSLTVRDVPASGLEDCVAAAYAAFEAAHPGRGEALRLYTTEGWSGVDFAAWLGRSHGAAREYLSQCRARFIPFVRHCREWLEA